MGWTDFFLGPSDYYGSSEVDREWNRKMAEALLLGKADQPITHGGWAGALGGTANVLRALSGVRYRDASIEGGKKERDRAADTMLDYGNFLSGNTPGKPTGYDVTKPTRSLTPSTTGSIDPSGGFNPGFDMKKWLQRTAMLESGGNISLINKFGYGGKYQFSPSEAKKYGLSGDWMKDEAAQDRAMTALSENNFKEFEKIMGRKPSAGELYLAHQQGIGGATSHLQNPDTPAWINMLNTAEGRQRGEAWAKRAISANIPKGHPLQRKPVEEITSREFAPIWINRYQDIGSLDPESKMALGNPPATDTNVDPSSAKHINKDMGVPTLTPGEGENEPGPVSPPLPGRPANPVQLAQAGGVPPGVGAAPPTPSGPSTLGTPAPEVGNRPLPNAMPDPHIIREMARNTTIDPLIKQKFFEKLEKEGGVQKLDTPEGIHMWDRQGRYSFIPKAIKSELEMPGGMKIPMMGFFDPETKKFNFQMILPGESEPEGPINTGRGAPRLGGPGMPGEGAEVAQAAPTHRPPAIPALPPGESLKGTIPGAPPKEEPAPAPIFDPPGQLPRPNIVPKTGNPLDKLDPYIKKVQDWEEAKKTSEGALEARQGDVKKAIEDGKIAKRLLKDVEILEKLENMPGTADINTGPLASYILQFKKAWNSIFEGKPDSQFPTGPMTVEQMFNRIGVAMAANAARQSDPNPTVLQFQKMLENQPGLSTTPEGRRQITKLLRKSAERDIAVANAGMTKGLDKPRNWGDIVKGIDDDPAYKYTPEKDDLDYFETWKTKKKNIDKPTEPVPRVYDPVKRWGK